MNKIERMVDPDKTYAVITGDLVNSRAMSPSGSYQEMEALRSQAEKVATLLPDTIVGAMDIFQHDSFQLLLQKPEHVATVALYLHTGLANCALKAPWRSPVRMSIGLGRVDLIDYDKISRSRGYAFTMSGAGVRKMREDQLLMINADGQNFHMAVLMNSAIMLIDILAGIGPIVLKYLHGPLTAWLLDEGPCIDDIKYSSYHTWLQLKESLEFFTRFSKDVFYKAEEKKKK
jgi:hypothetical protein